MPAGALTLPFAALAAAIALAAGATGAPGAPAVPSDRVALEVAGVLEMPESPAAILVLREKGATTVLPIIVPDGHAIAAHGRTHPPEGLLGGALQALGARVAEVEIEQAEETSSGACVRLTHGGRRIELHASPSESVALALSAGAPIVTSRRVMDESGLTPEDLARAGSDVVESDAMRL
jgi:hypothetical protein